MQPRALTNKMRTVLILMLLSLPLTGAEAAQRETFAAGPGIMTCAQFGEEYGKNTLSEFNFFYWTQGWLSAENGAATTRCGRSRTLRNLFSVPINKQMLVIREHCAAHPLELYTRAIAFMRDKYLKTVTLPPLPAGSCSAAAGQ
jgi:hypothetical protein